MNAEKTVEQSRTDEQPNLADELILLGAAMLAAQKLEFALYGMAAHLKDKHRQFQNLNPEEFLRGDGTKTKATLGAIVGAFAPQLAINGDELDQVVRDRNLIAHDYWRMTRAKVEGGRSLENPKEFLNDFGLRCDKWGRICNGWIAIAISAAAEHEGSLGKVDHTPETVQAIEEYLAQVAGRQGS